MSCKHCKTKCQNEFCCLGCEAAFSLIDKLGLAKFYEYTKELYQKNPTKVEKMSNSIDYKKFINFDESTSCFSANLIVDGIHCGSCVWLIENTLLKQENVKVARLNLSTKRLHISWKGDVDYIDKLVDLLLKLGYKLTPYRPDFVEIESQNKSKDLLKSLIVAGFASISMMMILWGVWAGRSDGTMSEYMMRFMNIISLVIAVPATLYSGMTFFSSAWSAIKARRSNMDVPISIAVLSALFVSIQETIRGGEYVYFDAAISLVFFLLIGRYLDHKSREKARERAKNLVLSQSTSITLQKSDGVFEIMEIEKASVGDVALVAVGEKIPADGLIIEGETELDNSIITGESLPIKTYLGMEVIAGSINLTSPIKIKITKLGEDTTLAQIIKLMENAEQGKSKFVELADRVAALYTPIVLSLSFATLVGWLVYGKSLADALLIAISVLIITCPCALGLAVPIVQVVAISRLISKGIVVKTKNALEKLNEINYVVFDKTGTLTKPNMNPVNLNSFTESELKIIRALASHSKHVLAKALNGTDENLILENVEEIKGYGLKATFEGKEVLLGSQDLVSAASNGETQAPCVWFKLGDNAPKAIIFSEELKEDAVALIEYLNQQKFGVEIVSGDKIGSVTKIAKMLGVVNFKYEFKPQDKFDYVNSLMREELKVMMVGDGLNDSAALAAAHVSVSPSNALEISQTASDIVIQGEGISPIIELLNVAKKSNLLVKQNIFLSLFYNVFAVPLAMLGYASPIAAAIVMSLSSIVVVGNSLRLK